MHRVLKEKPGEIAWVYRHYPLVQLHSKAAMEASATECAWEQGGNEIFWKYLDRLFEITPSNNGLPEEELTKIAQDLGLNVSSFYTCFQSGKYAVKVDNDVKDGQAASINGTPTSFVLVRGKIVDTLGGAAPFEEVMRLLEKYK